VCDASKSGLHMENWISSDGIAADSTNADYDAGCGIVSLTTLCVLVFQSLLACAKDIAGAGPMGFFKVITGCSLIR